MVSVYFSDNPSEAIFRQCVRNKTNKLDMKIDSIIMEAALEILVKNHITIANFSLLYNKLSIIQQKKIKSELCGFSDRLKWLDGRANLPLKRFLVLCKKERDLIYLLKEARFSAKGVSSDYRVKLPLERTEGLAYFLGVLAGDGYISKPKTFQRGGWTVEMSEDDYEYQVAVYRPLVETLFGCTPKLYLNKRRDGRRNYHSNIHSFITVLYLTKILKIQNGYKTDKVRMPSILRNADLKLKLAFIGGLFDTDGTVTSGRVKWSTVSKGLYLQVKKILSEVGIEETSEIWLKNDRSKRLYTIKISRKSFERFNNLIGFKNIRKKRRLERLLAPSSSGQETINEDL